MSSVASTSRNRQDAQIEQRVQRHRKSEISRAYEHNAEQDREERGSEGSDETLVEMIDSEHRGRDEQNAHRRQRRNNLVQIAKQEAPEEQLLTNARR